MLELAKKLCIKLKVKGATNVLAVGGYVRDTQLNRECSDIDLEAHGLSYKDILEVVSAMDLHANLEGQEFGVVRIHGKNIDISLPRLENRTGLKHTSFDVEFKSNITIKEAAARRDFTINSMALDLLTGKLHDPYNGLAALGNKLLIATSEAYREDPLRVLRGMQFASRYDLTMEHSTALESKRMLCDAHTLSKERMWLEWKKWAQGSYPSKGLDILTLTGWIHLYPELSLILNVPQDPHWHPEGNVWQHTKDVTDAAAYVADREGFNQEERAVLLLSALLHDTGKAITTDLIDGKWRSPAHAYYSRKLAKQFLSSIIAPKHICEKVLPLIVEHMASVPFVKQPITERVVRRLSRRLGKASIAEWRRLLEADTMGTASTINIKDKESERWLKIAEEIGVKDSAPKSLLTGNDVMHICNIKPGAEVGIYLKEAYEAQLDGEFTTNDEARAWLKAHINP